jgi:hypothetical protein
VRNAAHQQGDDLDDLGVTAFLAPEVCLH